MNKQFVRKVGWWVSTTSLGMTLAVSVHTVHAGEVRQLAQAQLNSKTHYSFNQANAQLNSVQTKPILKLTREVALRKGLSIVSQAKTAKEYQQAFKYLNYAAKKGLPEAMFQCALMYLDNEYTPADDERAMSLLEQASKQGHKQAEIALNYIQYADGGIGC